MTAAETVRPAEGTRSLRKLSQVHKWWSSKIAPLVAISYLALTVRPRDLDDAAGLLLGTLWSACLLATAAYVVNDWFDREEDRALGKQSAAMGMSGQTAVAIHLGLVVAGVIPWLFIELDAIGWFALLTIITLPLVYSAPPIRSKERGWLGLIADAGLAHIAPTVFVLAAFGTFADDDTTVRLLALVTIVWSGALGLRSIVDHEIVDLPNDQAAGVHTWVAEVGRERASALIQFGLLPVEGLAIVGMFLLLGSATWLPAVLVGLLVVGLLVARVASAWTVPFLVVSSNENPRPVLFVFYQFWFGTILLIGLVVSEPSFLVVLPVHLLVFWPLTRRSVAALAHSTAGVVRRLWWVFHDRLWHPVASWLRYRLPEHVKAAGRGIRDGATAVGSACGRAFQVSVAAVGSAGAAIGRGAASAWRWLSTSIARLGATIAAFTRRSWASATRRSPARLWRGVRRRARRIARRPGPTSP